MATPSIPRSSSMHTNRSGIRMRPGRRDALFPIVALVSLFLAIGTALFCLLLEEYYQPILFLILLGLSFIFSLAWILPTARDNSGRMDIFHPSLLFLLFYFVYYLGSSAILVLLTDYQPPLISLGATPGATVNIAIFLGIISVACFGVGMRLKASTLGTGLLRTLVLRNRIQIYAVAVIFIAVGLSAKLYHLSLYGTLGIDTLLYLSPTRRASLELGISQTILVLGSMADWGCLLYLFGSMIQAKGKGQSSKGSIAAWTLLICIAVLSFVVSGKRSSILIFVLPPLVWTHYLRRRFSISRAVAVFALTGILIAAGLMMRIVVPLLVEGIDPSDYVGSSFADVLTFYLGTAEFSTFDMVIAAILYREDILEAMGDNTFLSFIRYTIGTFSVLIPSAAWPDKPVYEDPGHVFFRLFAGSDAQAGLAITVWGTAYLFFHIAGIVIGFLLLGWLVKSAYTVFSPLRRNASAVFLYAIFYWMLFQFLRFGTLGFTFLYFIQALMFGVVAIALASRKG